MNEHIRKARKLERENKVLKKENAKLLAALDPEGESCGFCAPLNKEIADLKSKIEAMKEAENDRITAATRKLKDINRRLEYRGCECDLMAGWICGIHKIAKGIET